MNVNVGGVDRTIRIVVGLALIVAAFLHLIGPWGWLGLLVMATGLFRFCPAYRLFGASTCPKESAPSS